jgi:hypothetical protein
MERHQIENPDLKEYRAKACKSSKERSPADSYDPYFGCVGCASQKARFRGNTTIIPLLQYQCASSVAKLHDAG